MSTVSARVSYRKRVCVSNCCRGLTTNACNKNKDCRLTSKSTKKKQYCRKNVNTRRRKH